MITHSVHIISNFGSGFATIKTYRPLKNLQEVSQHVSQCAAYRNGTFSKVIIIQITVNTGHYRRSQLDLGGIQMIQNILNHFNTRRYWNDSISMPLRYKYEGTENTI